MSRVSRKEDAFFRMFKEFSALNVQAVEVFEDIVRNFPNSNDRIREVKEFEVAGDELVSKILATLNESFITPFDREDISALTKTMDEIVDGMEGVSARFDLYDVHSMRPEAIELTALAVSAVSALDRAFSQFSDYKKNPVVRDNLIQAIAIEDEADRVYRNALGHVFRELKDEPIEAIKWKSLLDKLEGIFDSCEDVANITLSVILKNA